MTRPTHLAVNAVALGPGGGLTYLVNQAQALRRQLPDWRMTYFVAPSCRDTVAEAVGPESVQVPFTTEPSLLARLRWEQLALPGLLRAERVDVLYGVGGFAVLSARVPQLLFNQNPNHHATRRDIGLSRTLAIARVQRVAARVSVRRATAVIYGTQAFADAMASVGFPPPTDVVPSGLATDWGSPAAAAIAAPGGPYALAVHNWYRHKRIEWLIDAWMEDHRFSRWALVLAGAPVDGRTTRRVRSLMARYASDERLVIVESSTRAQLRSLFAGAQLYLSASVLEAFPLTPFEAMSEGAPCVLSDIPTHREVAGPAAEYFPPEDTDGLACAVSRADRRRLELVALGRQRIAQFPWSDNAASFRLHLERLAQVGEGGELGRSDPDGGEDRLVPKQAESDHESAQG